MARVVKYYSEQLGQLFNSLEELEAAENKANADKQAEEEKKAQLKATREARAKEVEEAIHQAQEDQKKANASNRHAANVLNAFVKDFGAYHTSVKSSVPTIWDALWNLF